MTSPQLLTTATPIITQTKDPTMASANTVNESLGLDEVIDGMVTKQPLLPGFSLRLNDLFALGANGAE